MLEEVTNEPLATLYRRYLLDPLDLDDTWLDGAEPPRAAVAPGFHPRGLPAPKLPGRRRVARRHRPRAAHGCCGRLLATATDVATVARGLFTGQLFDRPTRWRRCPLPS